MFALAAPALSLVLGHQQAGLGIAVAAARPARALAGRPPILAAGRVDAPDAVQQQRVGGRATGQHLHAQVGQAGQQALPQGLGVPVQVLRARHRGAVAQALGLALARTLGASMVPRQALAPQRQTKRFLSAGVWRSSITRP